MRVRIFTLKFHAATERFDDDELQDFIKDKEVLSIREHFFLKQETPYLVVFLTYRPGEHDIAPRRQKKEPWRELLSDEQLPLYNTLRDWRNERARQEGGPPYLICNNQLLAQIATSHPASLADLGKIHGIGKAKLEKYGKDILAILKSKSSESQLDTQDGQQRMFEHGHEKETPGKEQAKDTSPQGEQH